MENKKLQAALERWHLCLLAGSYRNQSFRDSKNAFNPEGERLYRQGCKRYLAGVHHAIDVIMMNVEC